MTELSDEQKAAIERGVKDAFEAMTAGRLTALESQVIDPEMQGAVGDLMRSAGYPHLLWQRVRALEQRLQSIEQSQPKEHDMSQSKLSWFDRLLMKIALARAAARGILRPNLARDLKENFVAIREP